MHKIGLLTFHSPHNYGSMLQAYALQQVIVSLGHSCDILDFRPMLQEDMYMEVYKKGRLWKRLAKTVLCLPLISGIKKKNDLFESFLSNDLNLSRPVKDDEMYLRTLNAEYDAFICGSDQIWNVQCRDFDWLFYLGFADSNRIISYAPSMGPNPSERFSKEESDLIKQAVSRFRFLSVREHEAAVYLSSLLNRVVPVMLDPTLLLPMKKWSIMAGEYPIINVPYILVYTPTYHDYIYEYAEYLGEKIGLKVVVTQFNDMHQLLACRRSVFHLNTGPKEFLNLCKFSSLICTGSFHAVVFSIMFHKEFIAVNGGKDARITNLMAQLSVSDRIVNVNVPYCIPKLTPINYQDVDSRLQILKESAVEWLDSSIKEILS